jgi:hypothetical protein
MSSFSSYEAPSTASQVDGIKTSGEEARAGEQNVLPVPELNTLKGGKRNKSRKNRTRKGGKKNVGGKRKSAKKSRSRK